MEKPGYKTSEFWVTVAVQIVGIFAAAGIFTTEEATQWQRVAEMAGGLIAMVVSALAYSNSRGTVKSSEAECCAKSDKQIGEQGFTSLNLMAVVWLCLALIFSGCVAQTPAEKSICSTQAEASGSVICRIATERGWTVEDIDTMLLDATITAWAFDIVQKQEIIDALDEVEKYVLLNQDVVLKAIVDMLVTDSKKSEALKSVLSRRLKFLDVPEVATSYDIYLILTEVQHQREQFGVTK